MERSFPPRLKIPRSTCYTENTSGTSFQKKKKRKRRKRFQNDIDTIEDIEIARCDWKHYRNCARLCLVSCNVMNRCHPYAQCIYVTSTADYECRCNQGYEGDGMECIKTGTFFRHLLHLRFSFRIYRIHRVFLREENTRETRVSSTNSQFPVVLNAEVSCLEVDICDPNASCQQEESLAKCVCNPGFEGDGTMCSPIGHISYLSYLSSSSLSLPFLYRSSTRRKHPHPRKDSSRFSRRASSRPRNA